MGKFFKIVALSGLIFILGFVKTIFAQPIKNDIKSYDSSRKIEMTCGGMRAQISCGYNKEKLNEQDSRICNNNKIVFTSNDKKIINPPLPVEGFFPEALFCATTNKKKNLLLVTYSSGGPSDCGAQCNIVELYTPDGLIYKADRPWLKVWAEENLPTGFKSLNIQGK